MLASRIKGIIQGYNTTKMNLLYGYVQCKIIIDNNRTVIDCFFIEVNKDFELLTGLKERKIIGKSVNEIMPGLLDNIQKYSEIFDDTNKDVNIRFEYFSEKWDKWFSISIYNESLHCFSAIFQDITDTKKGLELTEKDTKYKVLFNSMIDAAFLVDHNSGRILEANHAAARMYDYSCEELQEMVCVELSAEQEKTLEALKSGSSCIPLRYHKKKDGTVFPIEAMVTPFMLNEQKAIIITVRDISELKNAEGALRENESKYKQLVENAQEGIWTIDRELRITFVNPRMAEMLDYSVEELIGKPVFSFIPKEEIEEYVKHMDYLKQGQKISAEGICIRKDGSSLYVSIAISPVMDGNGEFTGGLTLINDITDRKSAETSLMKKDLKFKSIVKNIFEIIFLFDSDGRCTYASPNWNDILGYEAAEVEGQFIYSFIHPDHLLHCIRQFEEIYKTGGKASDLEYMVRHKDRSWHWYSLNVSAIKYNNGMQYLGIARDITERKQKDEEIRYLNFHDQLTGLYNRTYLESEIARLDMNRLMPLSVIVGDINSLKLINDVFGYQEGDKLLLRVARILENACRKEDIIVRWDGDEFMILLPQTEEKEAVRICEGIDNACLSTGNSPVQPSIALGIAVRQDYSQDLMKVFKQAEERMFRNKLLENKSNYSSILTVLENTLFERSYEKKEHVKRLCRIATQVGSKIGLSVNKIKELELLCLLHDIGKVAIPDRVLLKPGKLDREEWKVMKKHPEIGCRIVKASHELTCMSGYILSHHEYWNGKGYPQGLKGDEIPELSRIVSIVDAYDVMTHRSIYKEAVSHQEAVFEIQRCAGTQFDPDIVSVFTDVINGARTAGIRA